MKVGNITRGCLRHGTSRPVTQHEYEIILIHYKLSLDVILHNLKLVTDQPWSILLANAPGSFQIFFLLQSYLYAYLYLHIPDFGAFLIVRWKAYTVLDLLVFTVPQVSGVYAVWGIKRLGNVWQTTSLFSQTVKENVCARIAFESTVQLPDIRANYFYYQGRRLCFICMQILDLDFLKDRKTALPAGMRGKMVAWLLIRFLPHGSPVLLELYCLDGGHVNILQVSICVTEFWGRSLIPETQTAFGYIAGLQSEGRAGCGIRIKFPYGEVRVSVATGMWVMLAHESFRKGIKNWGTLCVTLQPCPMKPRCPKAQSQTALEQ